jgi:surface protein
MYFRRITSLTRFVLFFLWFETGWVWSFFFFVAPFSLLAVFRGASVFNQDVSTWNTGTVITMTKSKCTLPLSLFWCLSIYTTTRVGSQFSHVLFFLFVCGLKRDLFCCSCCVVGLIFLFLCCTLHSLCSVC